mmetsp:Transcript_27435/g.20591  ORF Transcript_27435/g.20591 Transcript_27435/m.20591 type:complete len:105 (+) Transcript_27435:1388-1702(+)
METVALSVMAKKNELAKVAKEKGKDNMQAKIIQDEVEEYNSQLKELKGQLEGQNYKMTSLLKRREQFSGEWRQAGVRDIALELLNHILRENVILVESLESQRKE